MASIRAAVSLAASLTIAAVLAGGCGPTSDGDSVAADPHTAHAEAGPAEFPVTVTTADGQVTVDRRPRRIVSMSPAATEMLFAIGAGNQVVAVDDQSNYPPTAPQTKLSAYQPSVEAIAGYRPDLVVISDTSPGDLGNGLTKVGVTVLREPSPNRLRGAYQQIRRLGVATGHRQRAGQVADKMRSRLRKLFAAAPDVKGVRVFHELGPDLYSASSHTFIGRVYARLGMADIADKAASKAGSRYPKLSPEYVVSADPDLIVLADRACCDVTPKVVRGRPGWSEISAVQHDSVITVNKDVSSRWGPRLPRFVATVVRAMKEVQAPTGNAP